MKKAKFMVFSFLLITVHLNRYSNTQAKSSSSLDLPAAMEPSNSSCSTIIDDIHVKYNHLKQAHDAQIHSNTLYNKIVKGLKADAQETARKKLPFIEDTINALVRTQIMPLVRNSFIYKDYKIHFEHPMFQKTLRDLSGPIGNVYLYNVSQFLHQELKTDPQAALKKHPQEAYVEAAAAGDSFEVKYMGSDLKMLQICYKEKTEASVCTQIQLKSLEEKLRYNPNALYSYNFKVNEFSKNQYEKTLARYAEEIPVNTTPFLDKKTYLLAHAPTACATQVFSFLDKQKIRKLEPIVNPLELISDLDPLLDLDGKSEKYSEAAI